MAAIVVPPGEVTISRSSTGWVPVSRSILAEPSIVWTISSVATSRDSPSRMQASIIASASRKKYAGPLPLVAVTASRCCSGSRRTLPTVPSSSLRDRQMLLARRTARRDDGHRLVDHDRHVRHHAHDGHAVGQLLLDERRPHPGGEADHGVARLHVATDLLQQRLDVLGLGHQHQHVRPTHGVGVVERRRDAVLARELACALLAAVRDHDVVAARPPERIRPEISASAILPPPRNATRRASPAPMADTLPHAPISASPARRPRCRGEGPPRTP